MDLVKSPQISAVAAAAGLDCGQSSVALPTDVPGSSEKEKRNKVRESFWWSHSLRTPGSCNPRRHVIEQTTPERATLPPTFHRLLVASREKAGATYKVAGRVSGKERHTCALPWPLE